MEAGRRLDNRAAVEVNTSGAKISPVLRRVFTDTMDRQILAEEAGSYVSPFMRRYGSTQTPDHWDCRAGGKDPKADSNSTRFPFMASPEWV